MDSAQETELRQAKGLEIAKTGKIRLEGRYWRVPSQNINKYYEVIFRLDKSECNCPDYQERQIKCKHIFAVEATVSKSLDRLGGSISHTEIKRITYPQNWSAYNASQLHEQDLFMKLLSELCTEIEEPLYKFGRPRLPLSGMVFSSAMKVYSTFSLRRFMCDMRTAKEKGYANTVSSYSSVSNYMRRNELTPVLQTLIILSAMPLRSVETRFAIDSTGFRTTKFSDYCKEKHETRRNHQWVKAHICTGIKTNIITAVEITGENGADSPQFIPLSKRTSESGFKIEEISADKAYNSKNNYNAVDELGGKAYIPFKSNASPWSNSDSKGSKSKLWRHMLNYFIYKREEFLEHYHVRSNVESTNNMIKAKFTDLVRSKDRTAQINEVLLKVLCHNICVLIQEMAELGIEPDFLSSKEV